MVVVLLNWERVLDFIGQTFLDVCSAKQSARCKEKIDDSKSSHKEVDKRASECFKVYILFSKLTFDSFTFESLSSTFKPLVLFLDR